MTLIECFTEFHIDNIAACLRLQPEKLFLVGDVQEMGIPAERYKKLLKYRSPRTKVMLCDVRKKDFGEIGTLLEELIHKETDCVIDLTGGDETVIMAVGAVLARLETNARQQLRVEKYDYTADAVLDCIHDNQKLPYKPVKLTVEELVELHGGKVLPEPTDFLEGCSRKDIDGLWQIASRDPKSWNRVISYLTEFEKDTDVGTEVRKPLEELRGIRDYEKKETAVRELLAQLEACGVIENHSSRAELHYTYVSPMLRYCTRKAGNVLEIKTLLEGRAVLDNGAPCFHDCRMGVRIDWDGIAHKLEDHTPDTQNEIDVVLMQGMTPLFISCKNGNIGDEELYKLNTVAHRFGGPHARKMLIATDLDRKSVSGNRSFMQRAWDMDIFLETDAAKLTREEWPQVFREAVV